MDARTQLLIGRAIGRRGGRPTTRPAFAGTTCCGPCREQNFCRDDANCCLECHFHYEEQLAFPCIPEEGRQILRQQHIMLIAKGFPHEELEAHAKYEMLWFRPYCPPPIVAQIDQDHVKYGEGTLHSSGGRRLGLPPILAPVMPTYAPAIAGALRLAPISVAGQWVSPYHR